MNIVTPGHRYQLRAFESPATTVPQTLQFIEKRVSSNDELITIQNGTTNEEVLEMMIDRFKFLNAKFPCRQNAIVITKLEEALMWCHHRTQERKDRGVEGQHVV